MHGKLAHVFTYVQNRIPELTHPECVWQCLFLGALADAMVILEVIMMFSTNNKATSLGSAILDLVSRTTVTSLSASNDTRCN